MAFLTGRIIYLCSDILSFLFTASSRVTVPSVPMSCLSDNRRKTNPVFAKTTKNPVFSHKKSFFRFGCTKGQLKHQDSQKQSLSKPHQRETQRKLSFYLLSCSLGVLLVNSHTPVSSGGAAGVSCLRQRSPLMAFIRAVLGPYYSSTPPHPAHSSRRAPQLPNVQQRSFNQSYYHTSSHWSVPLYPVWLTPEFSDIRLILIFLPFLLSSDLTGTFIYWWLN